MLSRVLLAYSKAVTSVLQSSVFIINRLMLARMHWMLFFSRLFLLVYYQKSTSLGAVNKSTKLIRFHLLSMLFTSLMQFNLLLSTHLLLFQKARSGKFFLIIRVGEKK